MDYYGTAAGFYAYHTARGRPEAAEIDEADVLSRLLVASEFFDGAFRDRFYGYKVQPETQVREWPRTGVTDYYGYIIPFTFVPVQVEYATYEIALRAPQLNVDSTPAKYKSVRIEGAISVEYASQDAASLQVQIPVLAHILQPLLGWRGGNGMGLSSGTMRA